MSFFVRNKRGAGKLSRGPKGREQEPSKKDEEVSSDSELGEEPDEPLVVEEEDDDETPQEKRFRLAKEYLKQMEEQQEMEGKDMDQDAIAHRLRDQYLEQTGRLHTKLAGELIVPILAGTAPANSKEAPTSGFRSFKGHRLAPTCLAISSDGKLLVNGSKDGAIIKWDLEKNGAVKRVRGLTAKDPKGAVGHRKAVLCLAISSDDKYLCSGGSDKKIHVWDLATMDKLKEFTGHKQAVTGLSFRRGHHQLFSCSDDRSVKVWDLDQMGYMDTMFGHLSQIKGIDSLGRERCISCGGRDPTVRIWKIAEESQLVYRAHRGCSAVDCLRLINEEHFVTGADDGSLSIWSAKKKKPSCVHSGAHQKKGSDPIWVSAVASLVFTDLIASGSNNDGFIRLWECSEDYKSLKCIDEIPVRGFVNDLGFLPDGSGLVAAVGQEHKDGRWWRDPRARNALLLFPLKKRQNSSED